LRHYDQKHTPRFALPLGGIGTGTVSLYGNGSLRDWEVMNRPGKGFTPSASDAEPFFAIHLRDGEDSYTRVLEGPLSKEEFEGSHGSRAPSSNLPRFRHCEVAASYPFARVMLRDDEAPVDVDLKAFNPMVPADAEASGIPVAVLRYELRNKTGRTLRCSVCGTLPNFVGVSGWTDERDWKGDRNPTGGKQNRNEFRSGGARGLFMTTDGVDRKDEAWGSLALATTATGAATYRTAWNDARWGGGLLDFWDDFSADGRLENRDVKADRPVGSLAVEVDIPAHGTREVTFLIAWHFPNRYGWNVDPARQTADDLVGNYYTTRYRDAWDVVEKTAPELGSLTRRTVAFVNAFLATPIPGEVKEAALFNASTLRTQTCFRTADGIFFGWEGCADQKGCCEGSCTHVWNYEQTTAFLYGSLALSMREIEFGHATNDVGLMSFRVRLPLSRAQEFGRAAADGQMGCLMKMHRDWRLSGDDDTLRRLWPKVRKSLEFCWIEGGWDADRDGVMEGVQHNTMDVEYFGPNPEMGFWYLGALRAAEEMARYLGEDEFAGTCRKLFTSGSAWLDANLFNGEYYEHEVRPVDDPAKVAPYFSAGMGASDLANPDFQLAKGCLADQLVGQSTAHVSGLGHLADPGKVRTALAAVWKYNHRDNLHGHFNPLRTFALEGEPGLLIADYPKERPAKPFPYYGEVWTGIEYTAAAGMLYEGLESEAVACVRDARSRYDGLRRSPYDEAECGHHYARAMAAWALVLALTGFQYSAVDKWMALADKPGAHFWSNGYAWGTCEITSSGQVTLNVTEGMLALDRFELAGRGKKDFAAGHIVGAGKQIAFSV
jgi:uncharacterized protein (DUF608 family)